MDCTGALRNRLGEKLKTVNGQAFPPRITTSTFLVLQVEQSNLAVNNNQWLP